MGQLTNLYVSQSYQGLIKLADSTTGVTSTLQYTQDGVGNNLPLQISETQVNITGSFTVNGVPFTNGTNGTSGTSGANGTSGSSGSSGTNGIAGTNGTAGSSGSSGSSGTNGGTGSSGSAGTSGSSGTNGIDGTSGSSGSSGSSFTWKGTYNNSSGYSVNDVVEYLGSSYISILSNPPSNPFGTPPNPVYWNLVAQAGTSGSSGTNGVSGSAGTSGSSGTDGVSGTNGTAGTSGTDGVSGTSGSSGTNGVSGSNGSSGSSGTSGTDGVSGTNGSSGTSGANGTSGTDGAAGSNGTSGSSGSSGTNGINGTNGTNGTSGSSGTSGQNGISAGRTYYFNQSQSSDVSPYKVLSEEPTTGTTQTVTTNLTNTQQNVLVSEYITPELGFSIIPAGVQRFHLHLLKPASNDDIDVYVTLQLANSTGGTIGGLITSASQLIGWNSGNPAEVEVDIVFTSTTIDPTNRFIVKIYLNNNDNTSHSVNYYTEGTEYSYVITSVGVVAGTSGTSGSSGSSGSSGTDGTGGTSGSSGSSGTDGIAGTSGSSGSSGSSGTDGTGGTSGANGTSGTDGTSGSSGISPSLVGLITTGSISTTQSITGSVIISGSSPLTVGNDSGITFRTSGGNSARMYYSGSAGSRKFVMESGDSSTSQIAIIGGDTNGVNIGGGIAGIGHTASTTVLITGSLRVTGSSHIFTGSLNVRGGDVDIISNNTTVNNELYLTNSLAGQANIILGWGDNLQTAGAGALQANYTGSLRITGSNNIVAMPQIRVTNLAGGVDQQGYISGSNNIINTNQGGIYLNTGSLLFPKTQGNIINSPNAIRMDFTTSSLTGGHPTINQNILNGGFLTLTSNSGSLNVNNNVLIGGSITSTQNFVTNQRVIANNNILIGATTLNNISSSITYNNNLGNGGVTINNNLSSSAITNNFVQFANNTVLGNNGGGRLLVFVSGSQSSNTQRQINDNLIGGRLNIISSSFVSSSNANLNASIIYGNSLMVSASHVLDGGTAFFGRFNATGSLQESAEDTVFVVGNGTSNATRRNALRIDNAGNSNFTGSVNISGSLTINGGSVGDRNGLITTGSIGGTQSLTGSLNMLSGTLNLQATQLSTNNNIVFNGSPNFSGSTPTFVSLGQIATTTFQIGNIYGAGASGSNVSLNNTTTNAAVTLDATWNNKNANIQISNDGTSSLIKGISDNISLTGSLGLSGSLTTNGNTTITGSVNISNVISLAAQDPLPAGSIGMLAVSASGLYFYNGAWTLIV